MKIAVPLGLSVPPSDRSVKFGKRMAARLFFALKPAQGPRGEVQFIEEHIAQLFAVAVESGRQQTLHDAFCLKGRQS